MTKQGDVSILSKAIQTTKNIAHKVITSYLLLCCGLMLIGGVFIAKLDVVVSANDEALICATKNDQTGVIRESPCDQLDTCKDGLVRAVTSTVLDKTSIYCKIRKGTVYGGSAPAPRPTAGGTPTSGSSSSKSSPADVANITGATAAPKLKALGLAPKTFKDPCEGVYGGQVKENSELFDCSKNIIPAFTGDDLNKTQPKRAAYLEAMCKNVNGTKAYSSPAHNQKWTCANGKLSGAITNITNDPIKRSQTDEWLKTAKINTPIKVPVEGSEFLGRNFGCAINKTTVRLLDLPNIGNFVPIIPTNCTTIGGLAIPLSPILFVQVIVRLFGFLASFIFYLINFVLIYNGLMWVYGGIDGKSQETAKRNIGDLVWGLVLLLGAYVIISTIIGLIGAGSVETDLTTFFNINTKI